MRTKLKALSAVGVFWCVALLAMRVGAQGEPERVKPVRIISKDDLHFAVYRGRTEHTAPALLPWPGLQDEVRYYYLHFGGSVQGMFADMDEDERWMTERAVPGLGSRDDNPYRGRVYYLVYGRTHQKQHVNTFSRPRLMIGGKNTEEKELLEVTVSVDRRGGGMPGSGQRFFVTRVNAEHSARTGPMIYLNLDRDASFAHRNLAFYLMPNFSDVKLSQEFEEAPKHVNALMEAAVYIREFLQRPFPQEEDIIYHDARLVEIFDVEGPKLKSGDKTRLRIAFGLHGLRMMEMVRMTATSGGFFREGADVFYRAAKPGRHKITLEAILGTHRNGKVDYAERHEVEVDVE